MVVLDTVAGLTPRAELDTTRRAQDREDSWAQAQLMSERMRRMAGPIGKGSTCVIFVNQVRERVGGVARGTEVTPGGNALPHYSSVRLRTENAGQMKSGNQIIGDKITLRVVKNKVAQPFGEAEFDILSSSGINVIGGLLDAGLDA